MPIKKDTYGFTTDLGFIRLYAGSLSKEFVNFWEVPNLLMQKFPAEEFTATTKLTFCQAGWRTNRNYCDGMGL